MNGFENFLQKIASHVTADNVQHFASLVENLVKLGSGIAMGTVSPVAGAVEIAEAIASEIPIKTPSSTNSNSSNS